MSIMISWPIKRWMHRAIRRSEYFSIVNAIVEFYQSGKGVCCVRVCATAVCIRESMPNAERNFLCYRDDS